MLDEASTSLSLWTRKPRCKSLQINPHRSVAMVNSGSIRPVCFKKPAFFWQTSSCCITWPWFAWCSPMCRKRKSLRSLVHIHQIWVSSRHGRAVGLNISFRGPRATVLVPPSLALPLFDEVWSKLSDLWKLAQKLRYCPSHRLGIAPCSFQPHDFRGKPLLDMQRSPVQTLEDALCNWESWHLRKRVQWAMFREAGEQVSNCSRVASKMHIRNGRSEDAVQSSGFPLSTYYTVYIYVSVECTITLQSYYMFITIIKAIWRRLNASPHVSANKIAPWTPAKTGKLSAASACKFCGILSRLQLLVSMSVAARKTSGLGTWCLVLAVLTTAPHLSELLLRLDKVHNLSNKSLGNRQTSHKHKTIHKSSTKRILLSPSMKSLLEPWFAQRTVRAHQDRTICGSSTSKLRTHWSIQNSFQLHNWATTRCFHVKVSQL